MTLIITLAIYFLFFQLEVEFTHIGKLSGVLIIQLLCPICLTFLRNSHG